jgi:hypothetical protein
VTKRESVITMTRGLSKRDASLVTGGPSVAAGRKCAAAAQTRNRDPPRRYDVIIDPALKISKLSLHFLAQLR